MRGCLPFRKPGVRQMSISESVRQVLVDSLRLAPILPQQ